MSPRGGTRSRKHRKMRIRPRNYQNKTGNRAVTSWSRQRGPILDTYSSRWALISFRTHEGQDYMMLKLETTSTHKKHLLSLTSPRLLWPPHSLKQGQQNTCWNYCSLQQLYISAVNLKKNPPTAIKCLVIKSSWELLPQICFIHQ